MRKLLRLILIPVFLIFGVLFATHYTPRDLDTLYIPTSKKDTVTSNSNVHFNKMMDVLTSPRCINCHPNDNIPKQGDDGHPHYFGMAGGERNLGYEATKCITCHQSENNAYSGVPGAPEWSLAPAKMKWEGLTRTEIAKSMLNPANNGGRNLEELMHHLTEHELVLWAWEPGVKADGTPRKKPPVPLEEYKKAVKEWIANGAIVPED
ncbi:hypothetical protein [Ascidiimonas sp. W6]|uniref:hypothetical protein n=1 Tax=Ascidiimonas meishanensis TaxID=3128903 RepID=UPI0030ED401F